MRYSVGFFFFKNNTVSFFTAHGPPHYQERMAISVYSSNIMKYMENRITQSINSALYDKGTNLIRHIFEINITHCTDRYLVHVNPIRPGGGSEAQMAKLTAANQKPLIL